MKSASAKEVFYVPGEHDVTDGDGKEYLARYGKNTQGGGWYSFEKKGVHFLGLVNVMNLKAGGLGIAWCGAIGLDQEGSGVTFREHAGGGVRAYSAVVGLSESGDGERRIARRRWRLLKRFGSVTVLNGHIHQTMQKVEGSITFHTAASTAFPQPQPGKADSPGPMKVPAEELRGLLGITDVNFVRGREALAIVDSKLG